jgi:hypothetical protein
MTVYLKIANGLEGGEKMEKDKVNSCYTALMKP